MAAAHLDEQALFEVARRLDSPEARQAYLRQACGEDAATGKRVRALLKAYRKILELKPDRPVALNDVAWFLVTRPDSKCRDVDRALELVKRAVELLPQNGYSLTTLGIADYRAGDSRTAVSDLTKSTQLPPG
jgi:predicted TPR repeat methyltransferase